MSGLSDSVSVLVKILKLELMNLLIEFLTYILKTSVVFLYNTSKNSFTCFTIFHKS